MFDTTTVLALLVVCFPIAVLVLSIRRYIHRVNAMLVKLENKGDSK
jgi:hypothetical protein